MGSSLVKKKKKKQKHKSLSHGIFLSKKKKKKRLINCYLLAAGHGPESGTLGGKKRTGQCTVHDIGLQTIFYFVTRIIKGQG